MIRDVKLPEISEGVVTAEVVNILVSGGDRVEKEQPLMELETQKAIFELPAPEAGMIQEVLVSVDDEVKVGQPLLRLETEAGPPKHEQEARPEKPGKTTESREAEPHEELAGESEAQVIHETSEQPAEKERQGAEPEEKETAEYEEGKRGGEGGQAEEKVSESFREQAAESKRIPAAPSVRRFARETGADLGEVHGSGPGGRITRDDVKAYLKTRPAGDTGQLSLPDFEKWGAVERKPLSRVRKIIARNTAGSWRAIPHVTQFDEADITELEEFRKQMNRKHANEYKLTMTCILLKICAGALKRFPRFNASLDIKEQVWILKHYIRLGVAVDTDRGLLVPVIQDADRKKLSDLAAELSSLAERTRNRQVKPDELEGHTFTISNLGGIGGTAFTPVVYAPQVAILGVARAVYRPVWLHDEWVPRLMLPLCLSYDHRLIDGADGARFLLWICNALQNPWIMALESD